MPIGIYKHKKGYKRSPISEEWRMNLSRAHIGQIAWNKGLKGYLAGEKHWHFGKHWSEEIKTKMSQNRKGLTANENHPKWIGKGVGYRALHDWVQKNLGKADHCSFDSSHQSSVYHWANVSSGYLRDIGDWTSLCPICHRQYDKLLNHTAKNIFYFSKNHYTKRRVIPLD